ncbi:hypothetical protein BBO99_00003995 [Phytophthora kernoviae]|uniref:subtilisin n=2 Tax=Phytophthora kernoviae TaxID=325452 RepID=A0A3R7JQ87_9STRA|nr:hypothetical protein G195_006365 [Phytophthora kernoviae 00238/432]KAG2523756.1 hypothetical protein JM16_005215 [Phytophthora kernoviae]KAG2525544.1 hypothetical protein JM18_004858 [Phytophthora kernoviae]RLM95325.1 hypothetical protein BBI17_003210 [Phytophthora kernoviae]RLN81071.1 hypothetical protein BBO99_00003995 [Phytophthora kernoviae]
MLSFTSWYLDAFNYALFKRIQVLNLSTGGPDFQDLPFVDKVQELAANGIILVSAVGNDGPHYGMLSNPADQVEVIGVGGVTKNNEIAEFSSRGMTTWELPFGSGRVKPDIVTLAEDVPGADTSGGCKPLFHSSLPLMVNLTIMNPGSVVGTIKKPPQWISGANGEHLTISVSSPSVLWPYFGSIGVFIEVKEKGASFKGIVKGSLVLEVENDQQIDELKIPMMIKVVPTPLASKRILWDQFHNIPYPSAFVPRDNLENQHDLMDASGDHLHTNFHQLWNFLTSEGFFVEILPFEYSCLDLSKYGVVMVVDPEEEFFRDEIVALQAAIKYSNVSLIVFADWYDDRLLNTLSLFDTSTLSKWRAITGGANIPAINNLLHDFHIAFGDGVIYSSSVSLLDSGNDTSFPYWSGSYLTNFPVGGYLGYIDASDQSSLVLNRSEQTLLDVPVLGLYEVPSLYGGRIAVFGDSSCLDSSVHPSSRFRDCFGMLLGSERFGTHGAHRAQKYVDVVHFYDFEAAREYLKAKHCIIYGLSKQPKGAFGLSEEQRAICDHFVNVPFHGAQTEASSALTLDTTVETAITLHHFTAFAQFPVRAIEATSTQGKFVLDAYPTFDPANNQRGEEKAAMREAKRATADDGLSEGDGLGSMFD